MTDLAVEAESLIKHSLSENTWKTYNVTVESLNKFRAEYNLPIAWPISLEHLFNIFLIYLILILHMRLFRHTFRELVISTNY
jgi:hypothetical protein